MTRVAVIGAGPAGLTAALRLAEAGVPVTVLEADPRYVGGLSRTIVHDGFHFDIGGHRFFSKSKIIEDLWTEILPDDFLVRRRSSRIYYRGKFFSYPLKIGEAVTRLGPLEAAMCAASYLKARLLPVAKPRNFEDWVSNKFGKRLFNTFFKVYTEKVWGMSCREISADWAAQRIRGLSLSSAVLHALGLKRDRKGDVIKTLIGSFRYPRRGPGMMWEAAAEKVAASGGTVLLGHEVRSLRFDREAGEWTVRSRRPDGGEAEVTAEHVISSAPIRDLFAGMEPEPSTTAAKAAASLRYRDFITVALILRERDRFDDNWIYIHEPSVKVGRVQNFRSWSPEMVPDPALCCYGLEYFCFEGDGLWESADGDLVDLAFRELRELDLAESGDLREGVVVRQKKAYPVYDDDYVSSVDAVRREIGERYPGLHLVGRNGMHKYNNQDHAMMTAILTVENILADREAYDVWRVNQDAQYHETGEAGESDSLEGLRQVPRKISGS